MKNVSFLNDLNTNTLEKHKITTVSYNSNEVKREANRIKSSSSLDYSKGN
jgi:hypothetical protein